MDTIVIRLFVDKLRKMCSVHYARTNCYHISVCQNDMAVIQAVQHMSSSRPSHACSMDALHLISENICSFLDDIRPLSCAAKGLVAAAHWRAKAEQLWPGATANLPGEPKCKVRALCGNAPTVSAPFQQTDLLQAPSRSRGQLLYVYWSLKSYI